MASVFYLLVMFMLYTIMASNNNHLHCEAASAANAIDDNCYDSLLQLDDVITDKSGTPYSVRDPNGTIITTSTEPRILDRCPFVPYTKLSGRDFVLCKCKYQDLFVGKLGGNITGPPVLEMLNALDRDKELAKSCGFDDDLDCDTAFRSVLTPCETKAREVMKTCAPMVKAAAAKDVGNRRPRELCCSILNNLNCKCSNPDVIYKNYLNSTEKTRLKEFLHYANHTLPDKCGLSANNRSVCELLVDYYDSESGRNIPKDCLLGDLSNVEGCGPILQASDLAAVEAMPLVDAFSGCCLDDDSCKCDPRSVSCCQKLGELSKNKRDSCMCELLKSSTTPDSTLDFLNFVRSNYIQINSCRHISPVFTDTCVAPPPPPPPRYHQPSQRPVDLSPYKLRKGFRTPNNPNP